jgi:molecular chaperone IbpA
MKGFYETRAFKDLDRFFVGFDPIIKRLSEAAEQTTKLAQTYYPPYNIKKLDENKYSIEMAVAGFCKQDIELELAGDKLVIKGNTQSTEEGEFVFQGLARRPFTRTFTLADNVEVKGAQLLNGILRVGLEAIIPEANKPKKIEITDPDEEYPSQAAEFIAEGKTK